LVNRLRDDALSILVPAKAGLEARSAETRIGHTKGIGFLMPEHHLPTDEDRRLLRDSVRNFLATRWPEQGAVQRGEEPREIGGAFAELAGQGLAGIGSDPSQGGLREMLIVQQELGRAACPAPLLAASIANILLEPRAGADQVISDLLRELREGRALPAIAFGELDGDRMPGEARVGYYAPERTFELAHIRADPLADEERDFLRQDHPRVLRLGNEDGHTGLELGWLDGDRQTPAKS